MSGTMEYKGYLASLGYSAEDKCFFGKVEFINDLILFDGTSVEELEREFHAAVDSYLEFCKKKGKDPDQPFKGTFNVRVGEQLHRRASLEARRTGLTLNELVKQAIEARLNRDPVVYHVHHIHKVVATAELTEDFEWENVRHAAHIPPSAGRRNEVH